jgi:tetratricopeptide (TPR) repeat protein
MKEIFSVTGIFDRFSGMVNEEEDIPENEEYTLDEYMEILNEYREGEADILINIATIYFEEENTVDSLKYLEMAIRIYEELDYIEKKALVMDIMGDIYKNTNEIRTALEYYKESFKLYSSVNSDSKDDLIIKLRETEQEIKSEDSKEANFTVKHEDLPSVENISSDYEYISQDVDDIISMLKGATTYISYTKSKNPMEELENAYEMSNGIGDISAKATILMIMGDVSLKNSQPVEALKHFKDGLENFKQLNDQSGKASAMLLIGTTYYITGNMDKVPENFRKSIEILRDLNDVEGEAKAIKLMNAIYEE